ncbi:MAG: hypothetical protein LBK95_16465 [Bifidobacteriaceae bacterium]|jgi:hypothetical protein|nr:hypothetical protein [Bifidobacteriaceae bacterium]
MTISEAFAAVGQGPTHPITVTLNQGTLAAAREIAGPRGTSALIERALERELRRLALRQFIEDYEREAGPIPPEAVAAQRSRLAEVRAGN